MKATTLANGTIQLSLDMAEANGIVTMAEKLVVLTVGVIADPVSDDITSNVREVARELFEGAILANSHDPAAHPDSPALLRELDLRRGRLPWIDRRPRKYSSRASILAFDAAWEAGYRGWPKINHSGLPDRLGCRLRGR